MIRHLVLAILFSFGVSQACDCEDPGARVSKRAAEIVFRGEIVAFRESGLPPGRVAIFQVTRVWKGPVTERFEMLALVSDHACFGFPLGFLELGSELLVFGSTFGSTMTEPYPYLSMICATKLVKNAIDIQQLGRGHKPRSK